MVSGNPLDYWQGGIPKKLGLFDSGGGGADKSAAFAARSSDQHQSGNPYWQLQGPTNDAKSALYDSFYGMFGRAPTAAEEAGLLPSYNPDQNVTNLTGGNSQVAAYYEQQQNTPEEIYKRQQAQYLADAPKYADQVNQTFQSNLGRDATANEKTHFGALLASGQDPYQIEQALQQTTEYNTAQTKKFTDELTPQLQSTNADYFSKYILPTIQANNAQAGRTQDSSGYQAQLANAGQQQNYDLQNYLAQVQAGGYQQSVGTVAGNYQGLLGQQYGLQNAGVSNALSNQAGNQAYNQNLNMYQMQQQAYNTYLNNYGKSSSWGNALLGGLSGMSSGAKLGSAAGPWGSVIGGLAGGAAGGYGGYSSAQI